jgi:hypothetical protein
MDATGNRARKNWADEDYEQERDTYRSRSDRKMERDLSEAMNKTSLNGSRTRSIQDEREDRRRGSYPEDRRDRDNGRRDYRDDHREDRDDDRGRRRQSPTYQRFTGPDMKPHVYLDEIPEEELRAHKKQVAAKPEYNTRQERLDYYKNKYSRQ